MAKTSTLGKVALAGVLLYVGVRTYFVLWGRKLGGAP